MPRSKDSHEERARRRRTRQDAKPKRDTNGAERERGLMMRVLLRSPKDTIAATVAGGAVLAIIINAMFLQSGRHPSPMFGANVVLLSPAQPSSAPTASPQPDAGIAPLSSPLPRPRPAHADQRSELTPANAQGDSITHLVRAVSESPAVVRPPVPVAARSENARRDPVGEMIVATRRIGAVQRALTDYGYGQLRSTGQIDADTRAAIQKFERQRRLPVTGQLSDRLVREIAVATGRRID